MKTGKILLIALLIAGCAEDPVTREQYVDTGGAEVKNISVYENSSVEFNLCGLTGDVNIFIISPPERGVLTRLGVSVFRYSPFSGCSGDDFFSYEIITSSGGSRRSGVSIKIVPVNHPPEASNLSAACAQGQQVEIILPGADPDGDTLDYFVDTLPAAGSLSQDGHSGEVTYTPPGGFTGTSVFTYRVGDGIEFSPCYSVTIVIGGFNAPPEAVNLVFTGDEDAQIIGRLEAVDPEGDAISFVIEELPANGELSVSGRDFIYMPGKNFHGHDFFTFRADDGSSQGATASVALDIIPVNDAPEADDITISAVIDQSEPLEFSARGFDADGDFLVFTFTGTVPDGLDILNFPEMSYLPPSGFAGTVEIFYTASDGMTYSAGKIKIAVRPAGVWFVGGDSSGARDGMTWDTPFNSLDSAVAASSEGDEIWIKSGLYPAAAEAGSSYAILKKNTSVRGGFAGWEYSLSDRAAIDPLDTVFDGGGSAGRLFSAADGALIEGITLRGYSCIGGGCGLSIPMDAEVTVKDLLFTRLRGDYGAAVYVSSGGGLNASGCEFTDNSSSNSGGAIYAEEKSSVAVAESLFIGNTAADSGGGVCLYGSSEFVGAVFNSNSAENGGALFDYNGSAAASGSRFENNTAVSGGAVYTIGSFTAHSRDGENTVFIKNSALSGAALYADCAGNLGSRDILASGCVFSENSGGDIIYSRRGMLEINDSIFLNNSAEWMLKITGYAYAEISCVEMKFNSGSGLHASLYSDYSIVNSSFSDMSPAAACSGFGRFSFTGIKFIASPLEVSPGGDFKLTNCLSAGCASAPINMKGGSLEVYNSTFSDNGAGISVSGGYALFLNSILWNPAVPAEILPGADASISVRYSMIKGGFPGPGNTDGGEYSCGCCSGEQRGPFRDTPGTYCIDYSVRSYHRQTGEEIECTADPSVINPAINGGDPATPEYVLRAPSGRGACCGSAIDGGYPDMGYHGE